MNIEKVTDVLATKNAYVTEPRPIKSAASSNDNLTNRASQNENIKKLNALAEHMISEANALIIEKNPNGSGFIYKSIDRVTGEIVRIWPREEVIGMLEATFEGSNSGSKVNKLA